MSKIKTTHILIGATILASTIGILFYSPKKDLPENKINKLSIKPPIPTMDLPFEEHLIHPDSTVAIERNTGTFIQIPSACFRRADGTKPTEKISFKVREFHEPKDLLQSGIPMEVVGTNGQFLQSAGMIEMHAYEKGQELKISEDKTIGIELAGFRNAEGYSLYYLDNNQSWKVTDTFENKANERKQTRIKTLNIPTQVPDTSTHEGFIFQIQADLNENPELKPFANQSWELAENIDQRKLQRALRNSWSIANVKMTNKRKMEYRITFSIDVKGEDDKLIKESFSILAKPVFENGMSKKEQRREMERRMEEYATLEKQRIEELERVKKQADVVNTFKAKQMGIYNIDKIMVGENIITKVNFDFESQLFDKKEEQQVFMVLEENNSVIPVNRNSWHAMPIPSKAKFHFLAVISGEQIAYVSSDHIQQQLAKNNKEINLTSEKKPAGTYFKQNNTSQAAGN
jgi:hypothetical protein